MSALLNLLKKLNAHEQAPLAQLSTLKVGGPARYLVYINSEQDLCDLQKACLEYQQDIHIVSGGSNTLFSDQGFDGVVIKLGEAFDYVENTQLNIISGAASSFAKITKLAVSLGWAHAVGWSGTPGLIGGAVRMNAGTRLGEIKDALMRVHGVQNGACRVFEKEDILFGYRTNNLPKDLIITKAEFAYEPDMLKPVGELLNSMREYKSKRLATQPRTASLGSFFKNPYPDFAAQLIEKACLKGFAYKKAQISLLHANFIINNGGAQAEDILYVAGVAQKTVFENFGIMLTPEVRQVGEFNIVLDRA